MTERRSLFITFEGPDGSGKSTQLRLLAERLRGLGYDVVETAEPGGTEIGRQIRRILLEPRNDELCPTAELLLMFAARAQNVEQCILPALAHSRIVLSDRFTDSTLVYQGAGRGLGREVVMEMDRIACRGLKPDLTILVDVDVETGLARAEARNRTGRSGETRLDEQPLDFHRRVRDAYLELARIEPLRVRRIDGNGPPDRIAEQVWEEVVPLLEARLPDARIA
jgi:dTMP kinase